MALNHIGFGPQQNKLDKSTFGDGSGMQALANGIGDVVKFAKTVKRLRDDETEQNRARDLQSSEILAGEEMTIAIREMQPQIEAGEITAEEAQTQAFNTVRNSDYVRDYEEKYGSTPEYLNRLESNSRLWSDGVEREQEAQKGLSRLQGAYGSLSGASDTILAGDLADGDYSENSANIITSANALKDATVGQAQRQFAQSQVNSLGVALAQTAPTTKIARNILSKTTISASQRGTILRQVKNFEKNNNGAADRATAVFFNDYEADLLAGTDVSDRIAEKEALLSTLSKSGQTTMRRKLAKAEILGNSGEMLEQSLFDGDTSLLKDTYDLENGTAWEGDAGLLSGAERLSIVRSLHAKRMEMRQAITYNGPGGFTQAAKMVDRHPQIVAIQGEINAAIAAGDEHPTHLYKKMRDQAWQLHKNAGVPENKIIPVASYQVDAYMSALSNPASTAQERVQAANDFAEQAGEYTVTALNNIAANPKSGIDRKQLGSAVLVNFTKQHGIPQPQEFMQGYFNAQVGGQNQKFPSLPGRVNTLAHSGSVGRGIRDTKAGLTIQNTYHQEVAAGFDEGLTNYIAWEAVQIARGREPTNDQISEAITKVDELMGNLVRPIDVGDGSVVNLPTEPINDIYGDDIELADEHFKMFSDFVIDPESQDRNVLSEFGKSDNPFRNAAGFPVRILPNLLGEAFVNIQDTELVGLLFPGAGGVDSTFARQTEGDASFALDDFGVLSVDQKTSAAPDFTKMLPTVDWGKLDFLAIDPSLSNDPLFEDVNESNRADLNQRYFKQHGGHLDFSADGQNLVLYIRSTSDVGGRQMIEGYNLPAQMMYDTMGTWQATRMSRGLLGSVVNDQEQTEKNLSAVRGN